MQAISATRFVICCGLGGTNEHYADFHIFDTEIDAWIQPYDYRNPPAPRGFFGCCVSEEKVYVHGGSTGFSEEDGCSTRYLNDFLCADISGIHQAKFELPPENSDSQQNLQSQEKKARIEEKSQE